jgi:hypothetical protein
VVLAYHQVGLVLEGLGLEDLSLEVSGLEGLSLEALGLVVSGQEDLDLEDLGLVVFALCSCLFSLGLPV